MSRNRDHRLPPMTMSQYITAGLLLIFLEILFVVLSNEADIITRTPDVSWYCPYKLMFFANEQMKINQGDFAVKRIELRAGDKDTTTTELIHVFVIDQTTPNLEQTDMLPNYKDFMSPNLLLDQFDWIKGYPTLVRKTGELTPQNMASFYLFLRCLKDLEQFRYVVYDYWGVEGDSCLTPRRTGEFDEALDLFRRDTSNNAIAANNFLGEHYNRGVNATARTNFQAIFGTINGNYKRDILSELGSRKFKIVLNVISDFIHEEKPKNKHEKLVTLEVVQQAFNELMNSRDGIVAVNLLVMPNREKDDEKKEMRDKLIGSISSTCGKNARPMRQTPNKYFSTSKDLQEAIGNLPIKVPMADPVELMVHYPFSTGGFENSGMCRFGFSAMDDIDSVTLQLKRISGGMLPNAGLNLANKRKKTMGEIPAEPRMCKVPINSADTCFGCFSHPGMANDFADLSLIVSAKEYAVPQTVTFKFVEKMNKTETEILGYCAVLIMLFSFYWMLLLLTGKAFYNQAGQRPDWVDRVLFKIGTRIHRGRPYVFGAILLLFGLAAYCLMNWGLSAFKGAALPFASMVLLYVSITLYFHVRHFYIYTNPADRFGNQQNSQVSSPASIA